MSQEPLDALRSLVHSVGIAGRPLRIVVQLLAQRPHDLAGLVQASGVPRRTVQVILAAVDADLDTVDGTYRIRPERGPDYLKAIDADQLTRTQLGDPLADRVPESLLAELDRLISAAPRAQQSLDHVSATAETAVRRALWLNGTFELSGARLLCVGDHDLTSLAVATVNPDVEVTVVDLDERILQFIDAEARGAVRCLYSDLRLGLAAGAADWADLAITDPPYTPDGVQLFLARSVEGLRDRDQGRIVLAYGFAGSQPALGLKVQDGVHRLHLVYEAVLPKFNRYHGAQAIGSASDLYVLRPTGRSRPAAERVARDAATNIYTHGGQSLEGRPAQPPPGDSWSAASEATELATALAGELPPARRGGAIAVDASADPGPWLFRALLVINAPRLSVLVPNNHPDVSNATGQRELAELLAAKYRLTFRRSVPQSRFAVVEAEHVDAAGLAGPEQVRRWLLDRAHGKLANVWREALIEVSGGLTKNEARAAMRQAAGNPELLGERLIDLPRHLVRRVLAEAAAAAGARPG